MLKLNNSYNICVIDIGSPKLGNIGWCLIDLQNNKEMTGGNLDDLFEPMADATKQNGLILGLEAPLFVPLRQDLMLATRARKGEEKRPWSAGAGAQVLAINLPLMVYLFRGIQSACSDISYCLNEKGFCAKPKQMMIFEAFVSGTDKGADHIEDAQIMARSCKPYSKRRTLPQSILEPEDDIEYFNLVSAALLKCGMEANLSTLSDYSPIYKPNSKEQR